MTPSDVVILFGAGASFGAGHVLPTQPPLGPGLYDALATGYPKEWGAQSHLAFWADKLRHDFERTMFDEVLIRVDSLSLLEWHRCVSTFFAKFQVDDSGLDMYSRLLTALKSNGVLSRVTFGSLNYDCLFEQAVAKLGLSIDYMLSDTHSPSLIPLAKIHGSSNFVTEDLYPRLHLASGHGAYLESQVAVLPIDNLVDALQYKFSAHKRYRQAFFPVLGMYTLGKPTITATGKFTRLRSIFAQTIIEADTLALIGLKPTNHDPHLWDPIAQSGASKIVYIGGETDYAVLKGRQAKAIHLGTEFEKAFEAVVSAVAG